MKRSFLILAFALAVSASPAWSDTEVPVPSDVTDDERAVYEGVDEWIRALNAMFSGDPTPFADLYKHAPNITYMSAEGTYLVGWEATYEDWSKQAARALGGTATAADVNVAVYGDLAVAAHFTDARVEDAQGKEKDIRVRETSVFEKVGGDWKIVSHHVDNSPIWVKIVDR